MAKSTEKFAVTFKITNTAPETTVVPIEREVTQSLRDSNGKGKFVIHVATSWDQAFGFAMSDIRTLLLDNTQFPKADVKIEIEGVAIPAKEAARFYKNVFAWEADFKVFKETLLGLIAMTTQERGVAYIRRTDRNGVFKGTKDTSISMTQVAKQVVQKVKHVKFEAALENMDAEDSVWTAEDIAKLKITQAKGKERRLLLDKVVKGLLTAKK